MYNVSPKYKYIKISPDIIDQLAISGSLQPSLQIGKFTTIQKQLNLKSKNNVEMILVLVPYKKYTTHIKENIKTKNQLGIQMARKKEILPSFTKPLKKM